MKTIAKKTYLNPQLQIVMIQNQQPLLTGSNTNVTIIGRGDGGVIGDDDDPTP